MVLKEVLVCLIFTLFLHSHAIHIANKAGRSIDYPVHTQKRMGRGGWDDADHLWTSGQSCLFVNRPAFVLNCVYSLNKNDVLIHKVYLYCHDIFNTYLKCLSFYNLSDKTKSNIRVILLKLQSSI